MRAYGLTHKGQQRNKNEDYFDIVYWGPDNEYSVLAIADGMGGHQAGEVASKMAVDTFMEYAKGSRVGDGDVLDFLTEAARYANKKVYDASLKDTSLYGMGTTFIALSTREGKGYAVHIGDSRLYLINKSGMKRITTDHSYVNEMIKAGQMTEEEALMHPSRNALTRALGVGPEIMIDGYVFDFGPGDRVLMCTDGLTNMVREEVIYDMVLYGEDIRKCVEDLIDIANKNGGVDNITVVLAETER